PPNWPETNGNDRARTTEHRSGGHSRCQHHGPGAEYRSSRSSGCRSRGKAVSRIDRLGASPHCPSQLQYEERMTDTTFYEASFEEPVLRRDLAATCRLFGLYRLAHIDDG